MPFRAVIALSYVLLPAILLTGLCFISCFFAQRLRHSEHRSPPHRGHARRAPPLLLHAPLPRAGSRLALNRLRRFATPPSPPFPVLTHSLLAVDWADLAFVGGDGGCEAAAGQVLQLRQHAHCGAFLVAKALASAFKGSIFTVSFSLPCVVSWSRCAEGAVALVWRVQRGRARAVPRGGGCKHKLPFLGCLASLA